MLGTQSKRQKSPWNNREEAKAREQLMTDRIGSAAVRVLRSMAAALALAGGAHCEAADPPAASAPAASLAPATPELPHVLHPDAPLYPDYYALALAQTTVTDDSAFRALRLQAGAQGTPSLIVLPIQTQAFGFSPTFRAVVGARLDLELRRRHIEATRQTDIVDWRGPFVRRLDDATVDAFAAEHPGATLLTLYLGHDGSGHAFVTLGKRKDGKTALARRRVDIPRSTDILQDELTTLDLFAQTLLPLLADVGLGDTKPGTPMDPGNTGGCGADAWQLNDVAPNTRPDITACHALLMGTLMPNFSSVVASQTQPDTPARAAWLARAWVEADALAGGIPAMKDVATLAAVQLHLGRLFVTAVPLADSTDPVVRPLARMLTARERASKAPTRSSRAAVDDSVAQDTSGLPPFARAVAAEYARFEDGFLEVDLCPMSLALPHFRTPAGCEDEAEQTAKMSGVASSGQRAVLDEWRLAAAYKSLFYEGTIQGSAAGLAHVLADMPPSLARHPIVREMRFSTRGTEKTVSGIDDYLEKARRDLTDYAQAIATLQRSDALMLKTGSDFDFIPAAQADPTIARLQDDLHRLDSVETMDFWSALLFRPQVGHVTTAFLAPGSYLEAMNRTMRANWQPPRPIVPPVFASAGSRVRQGPPPTSTVWFAPAANNALPAREALEQALASSPSDETARAKLATVALEHGASIADARKIIEARPVDARAEYGTSESAAWASAARVFFYTGELQVAREYFRHAEAVGSGSDEEVHASVRLMQMAGDMRGALASAHRRMARYGSESSLREETSLLFLLNRRDEAWAELLPGLQTAHAKLPWEAALVGHRLDGTPLSQLPAWMVAHRVAVLTPQALFTSSPGPLTWLQTYETLDRLPSESDLDVHLPMQGKAGASIPISGGLVMRTAIAGSDPAHPMAFANDMNRVFGADRWLMQPFYAWALWNETAGKDPALEAMRKASVGSPFPAILARAMIQAADGKREPALEALTAARFELARVPDVPSFGDDYDVAPYDFVLATWLMTRKTGDPAYAGVGLKIARAYQSVWPWAAWPYAAESLLGADPVARKVAACRAFALDAGSMFLHESGQHPDPKSAVCRKAASW